MFHERGALHSFPPATINVPINGDYYLIATASPSLGYQFIGSNQQTVPNQQLAIQRMNFTNGVVVGSIAVAPHGGTNINNLAHSDYQAPTFNSPTIANVAASTGLSTDVSVGVPFTNVPQDGNLKGIAWYQRTYNANNGPADNWTLWAVTEPQGQPAPPASQTLQYNYTGLINGGLYDFAVGFVSVRDGFGAVTQVSPQGGFQVEAISLSQKILNNTEWPNGIYTDNGGTTNIDGAINNNPIALYVGPTLRVQGIISKGVGTRKAGFRIGIPNQWWYEGVLDGSGNFHVDRVASDNTTTTSLASATFQTTVDTNPHFYQVTLWLDNKENVYIEAMLDNVTLWVVDNNPAVLPNEVNAQVYTGSTTGTLFNYLFYSVNNSYALLPVVVQSTFNRLGTGMGLDNVVDGTTFKRIAGASQSNQITWASLQGDTSGNTNNPLVDGSNERWVYTSAPSAVQQVVGKDSNGNGILQLPNGVNNVSVTGNVPYGNSSLQVTSTINATSANNSYLNSQAVANRHVQSASIISTQANFTRYDTILNNIAGGTTSTGWYDVTRGAYITSSTVLTNGDYLRYNTGSQQDPGVSSLSQAGGLDTITLPAAANGTTPSSITVEFDHTTFQSGTGNLFVNFANVPGQTINPVLNSNTGSGQSQPYITSATLNNYYDDYVTSNAVSISQTATITPTSNNNYTNDLINGSNVNFSEAATITGGTTYTQNTGSGQSFSASLGASSTTPGGSTDCADGSSCPGYTVFNWTLTSNASMPYQQFASPSAYADGSHPITFELSNLSSSTSVTTGHSSGTNCSCHEQKQGTEYVLVCSCINVNSTEATVTYSLGTDYYIAWEILNPSSAVVASNNLTTNATQNLSASPSAATGTWYLRLTPVWYNDPGGSTAPNGGAAISATVTPIYYTTGTSYVSNPGGYTALCSSDPNTLAPNQFAISFTTGTVTNQSDGNGASEVDLQLLYPNGTVAQTWSNVASNTAYSFTGSSTSGSYTWQMRTSIKTNNGTGVGTYTGSMTNGYQSYYLNRNHPFETYPATEPSVTNPTSISTGANTDAPTAKTITIANTQTTSCVLQMIITNLSAQSDSHGSAALLVQLYDPSGNQLLTSYTDPNTNTKGQLVTANGTYTYSNASAPGGNGTNGYTWKLMTVVNTNNDNATATDTYTVSCTAQAAWYVYNNHQYTLYTNNNQPPAQFATPSSTIAPTSSSTQLTFTLPSVTTPSDASGTAYLVVYLQDPNGNTIYDSTYDSQFGGSGSGALGAGPGRITSNGATIHYSNVNAIAGAYTWNVFAMVANNQNGTKTYTCSYTCTYSEYIPGGGTGYVYSMDGSTQYTALNGGDIQTAYRGPDSIRFKLYNSSQQTIQITLGIDWRGF